MVVDQCAVRINPGSDESVWKDQPPGKRMAAMRSAASGKNFLLRAQDVPAVLDQRERAAQLKKSTRALDTVQTRDAKMIRPTSLD